MADKNSGIIDPPIDELLSKVDSKYQLVIFASKRARQINDYYADLHEGSLFPLLSTRLTKTSSNSSDSAANRTFLGDRAQRRRRNFWRHSCV